MPKIAKYFLYCVVLAILSSGPANSFEFFGLCFGKSCKENSEQDIKTIDPKEYGIEFSILGTLDDNAKGLIKSGSELWVGQDASVGGSAGLIARAKGDYRRILAGLYNEGFYAADISITINGQQAADFNPGDELPLRSSLRVQVDAGDLYRFDEFDIQNRAPLTNDENDQVNLASELNIKQGNPAKASQVRKTERLLIEEWRQQGYPAAKIANRTVKAKHNLNTLSVMLEIDQGQKAQYGTIIVDGADAVDQDFIAYMTGLKSGEEYDPDDIAEAKKRLDTLDVFATRKIDDSQTIDQAGRLPLTIQVKEKKLRRIGAGATLSSTDGIGFSTFWLHRNLFGKAERLRLEANVEGLGQTFKPAELDFSLNATFTKPGVFTPSTNWVSNAFAQREYNTAFEGETGGFSTKLDHAYNKKINVNLGSFIEYSRFKDSFGTRNFLTAGLESALSYDGRDSKIEPTKGFFAKFSVKPFHEFEYSNFGVKLDAELKTYLALDEAGKTVIAARLKAGSIMGLARDQTPANLLYLAGGGGSVRGFTFKNIGVRNAAGTLTGGQSVFETSVELRQRLNETFGLVAFTDAGTVGSGSFVDFSKQLSMSAGLGVRYYTDLGPIRLDVAVPINPGTDDPKFGVFAGIGQSF
jgi:translocation and assembly module TamA